jgi:hypothetical protein
MGGVGNGTASITPIRKFDLSADSPGLGPCSDDPGGGIDAGHLACRADACVGVDRESPGTAAHVERRAGLS